MRNAFLARATGVAASVVTTLLALPVYAATARPPEGGSLLDQTGLNATAGSAGLGGTESNDIAGIVGVLIGSVMGFAGILLVVLFIYAGFLWMTAQGDDAQVKRAKMIIKNAIIGTVLMFSAYAIASTVASFVADATQ